MSDGAERALYGYRYQMLCAVDEAIDLHQEHQGHLAWTMTIEDSQAEKADYTVRFAGRVARVVQAKTSLPSTSAPRVLTVASCTEIFDALAAGFPEADEVVIRTTLPASYTSATEDGPTRRVHQENETTASLTQKVIDNLTTLRRQQGRPSDPASIAALLAILVDHAHTLGQRPAPDREWHHTTFHKQVALSGERLAEVLGRSTWSKYWNVPHGSPIDRPNQLAAICEQLPWAELKPHEPPRVLALTGLSGIGKSTLAAQWARYGYYAYALNFWLPAATEAALAEAVRRMLTIENPDAAEWETPRLRHEWRQLLQTTPLTWLVVLDGVTDADTIHEWLPSAGLGHVLVTTTDATISPAMAIALSVPALTDHEALALLTTRLRMDLDSATELRHLKDLTDLLGRWPLALEMAAAWLSAAGRTLTMTPDYIRKVRDTVTHQQELSPPDHPRTVAASVIIALDDLPGLASALLEMCALIGGEQVPTHLATQCLNFDPFVLDGAVADLRRASLIDRVHVAPAPAPELADELTMNELVRYLSLQRHPASNETRLIAHEHLATMAQGFLDQENLPAVYRLAPCVQRLVDDTQNGSPASLELLTVIGNVAQAVGYRGDHDLAIDWLVTERLYLTALIHTDETPPAQRDVAFGMQIKTDASLCAFLALAERLSEALEVTAIAVPRCIFFWNATDGNPQLETPLTQFVSVLQRLDREGVTLADGPTPCELLSHLSDAIPDRLLHPDPAEEALHSGDYRSALNVTRGAFDDPHSSIAHVEALKRHAEAAAADGDRQRAITALTKLSRQAEALELGPTHLTRACLATARATAASLTLAPTNAPLEDTKRIGRDMHTILELAPPSRTLIDRAHTLVLQCLAATAQGTSNAELHAAAWAHLTHLNDPSLALGLLWGRARQLAVGLGVPLHEASTLGRTGDALVVVVPEGTFDDAQPVAGPWPAIRHEGLGLAVTVPTTTEPVTIWVNLNLESAWTQVLLNVVTASAPDSSRVIVICTNDAFEPPRGMGGPSRMLTTAGFEGRTPPLRLDPDLISLHDAGVWLAPSAEAGRDSAGTAARTGDI